MSEKNEFLRGKPKSNRKIVYDIINIMIPAFILIIGLFLFTQRFAELVNYSRRYCDLPIYILKHKIFNLPKGYPIFSPFVIIITMFTNPFDKAVMNAIAQSSTRGTVSAVVSIFTWLLISVIRSYIKKDENLYGTARWANEKDLKKCGLCEEKGVVLAQQWSADTEAVVNKKGNFAIKVNKTAKLICHSGTSHTLVIAPTRTGKGTGPVAGTLSQYPDSVIVFDPKGELYNMHAGYRAKFSHVIKFSPVQEETACFNPLEEVQLNKNAFRDIGTILTNIFQKNDKSDSNADFFDNNARDLLTGVIFHVLSGVKENGESLYPEEEKNIAGVLRIFARAASGTDEDGEPLPAGEELLDEMINTKHVDENGEVSDYIHGIVLDVAMSAKQQHEKVRSDIMQTVQSKLNLFRDPFISHVTSHSDFKLQDFYDSDKPISLFLTLPFGDIDRIMPVFQLIIDFILRRFSSGELRAGEKEKQLKHPILFLLDEFPTLGNMKFLAVSMGVLAGYGLRFMIIVQTLNQLVKIYGEQNAFLDNCRYILIYAPNNPADCKKFSEMIGKESVTKENVSVSGSRFAVALNNLNASTQDVARDLINPDELMKLPYTDCIVLIQGQPPYMAKKVAYYGDKKLSWKVFFENPDTGEIKTGFAAPYKQEEINLECSMLPSQIAKKERLKKQKEKEEQEHKEEIEKANKEFNPVDFLMNYVTPEEEDEPEIRFEEWDSPYSDEEEYESPPPTVLSFNLQDFNAEAEI